MFRHLGLPAGLFAVRSLALAGASALAGNGTYSLTPGGARIFQACGEFVANLPAHQGRKRVSPFGYVTLHSAGFDFPQNTQRPRQRFHHHRVAVAFEHATDCQRPANIASPSPRFAVQRNRGDQGGAPPPAIVRACPFVNHCVSHLPPLPDRPGEIYAERVRLIPAADTTSQFFEVFSAQLRERRFVMVNQLVGHEAIYTARRFEQLCGNGASLRSAERTSAASKIRGASREFRVSAGPRVDAGDR